jgi:hypothetical protein
LARRKSASRGRRRDSDGFDGRPGVNPPSPIGQAAESVGGGGANIIGADPCETALFEQDPLSIGVLSVQPITEFAVGRESLNKIECPFVRHSCPLIPILPMGFRQSPTHYINHQRALIVKYHLRRALIGKYRARQLMLCSKSDEETSDDRHITQYLKIKTCGNT